MKSEKENRIQISKKSLIGIIIVGVIGVVIIVLLSITFGFKSGQNNEKLQTQINNYAQQCKQSVDIANEQMGINNLQNYDEYNELIIGMQNEIKTGQKMSENLPLSSTQKAEVQKILKEVVDTYNKTQSYIVNN